jgi:hypothetical protein
MDRQPHIYTMPEQFLSDVGVPARWKVLAIVQGFWIAGKTVYATNEWLEKQTGYSRRQVQNALAELEEMDLITRQVSGMNRLILPGGAIGVHGGVQSKYQKGAVRVHHNSDSNSDSLISVATLAYSVEDSEDKPKKEPSNTKQYDELCKWLESTRGSKFVSRGKQYRALKEAREASISPNRLKERAQEQLNDPFYQDKGIDWGTVVSSFNRKA